MIGIVAITEFVEAGNRAFSKYIDYISRENAARVANSNEYDLFNNYLEYMGSDRKSYSKDIKQSNLFTRDSDDLTLDEKNKLKNIYLQAQKNESLMWQTVISFDNQYLKNCGIISNEGLIDETKLITSARKAIDKMLENENLQNGVWSAAIHYNTDNIHIHIATVEPVPMREKKYYRQWEKDSKGKIKYVENKDGKRVKIPIKNSDGNQVLKEAYKGTFKASSINVLKSTLRAELEDDKQVTIYINNMMRTMIRDLKEKGIENEEEMESLFIDLYKKLKKSNVERRFWNYNQKNLSALKPQISVLSNFFIDKYHKTDYEQLIALLEKQEATYNLAYGGSNKYKENKLYNKEDGLYTRLGNVILKELQNYDRNIEYQKKAVYELNRKIPDRKLRKEAIHELKNAAKMGNVYALNTLGILYLNGEYVKKDKNKAKAYFKTSSERDNSFGIEMYKKVNNYKLLNNPLIGYAKRDLNKAIFMLKKNLENEYESWKNKQSYDELQFEITHRGQIELD